MFKALHRRMDRVVALKTLPAKTSKDPATIARFEREVKAAAKLRHPNIVAADDADEAGGVHFLVMEFVDGQENVIGAVVALAGCPQARDRERGRQATDELHEARETACEIKTYCVTGLVD